MSTDTKKTAAAKRRAAALEKDRRAKMNAVHEKLGAALRRQDTAAAAALFAEGAAL